MADLKSTMSGGRAVPSQVLLLSNCRIVLSNCRILLSNCRTLLSVKSSQVKSSQVKYYSPDNPSYLFCQAGMSGMFVCRWFLRGVPIGADWGRSFIQVSQLDMEVP